MSDATILAHERFAKPRDVDNLTASVGAGPEVFQLMPAMDEIPSLFKRPTNPFVRLQQQWFFSGLDTNCLVAKPGVDRQTAFRHLAAVQGSFDPPHEHKEAGVAYLMSLWFDIIETPEPKSKSKAKPSQKPAKPNLTLGTKRPNPYPLKGGLGS